MAAKTGPSALIGWLNASQTHRVIPDLRPQVGDDAAFLRELFVSRRWQETLAAPGWNDQQRLAFLHSQADLQQQHYARHYADAAFMIIEQRGQPIGRLCVLCAEQEVRLVDVALLPAYQQQGFGSALLDAVLALADSTGKPCTLSVEPFSPARRLYERAGFEALALQGPYLQMRRVSRQPQVTGGLAMDD
ncbi:GNAT family N-acetyltransferase [Pseudomonas fakonensis]|uniref:GNAT family N-acetyltransferase n=1 Tax=Pseudomonas fakonensis TaxID=2842355 RepID=A0ABX8NE22_9PSED|nr:GNAT family N-acetyltransferase [Pseudomonas fakonensis]QXH53758.1 GNAT family N-acetyltransferase [Pseudomonas fakonensis]